MYPTGSFIDFRGQRVELFVKGNLAPGNQLVFVVAVVADGQQWFSGFGDKNKHAWIAESSLFGDVKVFATRETAFAHATSLALFES